MKCYRLFIAIELSNSNKKSLRENALIVKDYSSSGNFSKEENFHITLAFLGEEQDLRIKDIKDSMDEINETPFDISITSLDSFKRDGGEIVVQKIDKSISLSNLHTNLLKALTNKGFKLDNRPFKAHITLGREVYLEESISYIDEEIERLNDKVDHITLFKSERINGKLTYTPIYKKYFN